MQIQPTLELLPLRAATRRDGETTLPVLVRIQAPAPDPARAKERLPLNLALVLDRSGSMGGAKLRSAKQAARFAIEQLGAADRVSVVAYDDEVRIAAPSQSARDKRALLAAVDAIQTGGSTNLHGGWLEGATQVAAHLAPGALNRVLLLTDGLANVGETEPKTIRQHVAGLNARGVSTSCLGVGRDFNEDLLLAMAQEGDGNFYFIESAADLERIFRVEMGGLAAQFGSKVSLGVETREGGVVTDALNDFPKNELGRWMLPPLLCGRELEAVFVLRLAPHVGTREVAAVRLAFDVPGESERRVVRASLALPCVNEAQFEAMEQEARVLSALALLEAARERERVNADIERGDYDAARLRVGGMRRMVAAAPMAASQHAREMDDLDLLEGALQEGDAQVALKRSKSQSYQRRHGHTH